MRKNLSGKSHSAEKYKRGPSGVFEHPFFCKIEKNEDRALWRRKLRKEVSQSRNNMHKIIDQGRDSNPRPSVWQTTKRVVETSCLGVWSVTNFKIWKNVKLKIIKIVTE